MIYPLATSSWGKEEVEAIQKVIDTDMYTMGKHVKQFEQEFAKRIGRKYGIAVSSGTAGLDVSIAALDIGPGDEVITTPNSFIASTAVISPVLRST